MKAQGTLADLPDVARITVHAGQVLLYPRHTPPGLFVALAGVLCRFPDGTLPEAGCGDSWDASKGAFAIPAPAEVGEPAASGVAARSDALLLFVPRSVVLARTDVGRILAASGIAIVPLKDRSKRREQTVTARRAR
jgi:hypothetical protein